MKTNPKKGFPLMSKLKLILLLWLAFKVGKLLYLPNEPTVNPLSITIEELAGAKGGHSKKFVVLHGAKVIGYRYFFGFGYYLVTDRAEKFCFPVYSSQIRQSGQTIDLICYVQPIYLDGHSKGIILLKEVKYQDGGLSP